jgi:hypothetical protein
MNSQKELTELISKMISNKKLSEELDLNPVATLEKHGIHLSKEAKEKLAEFAASKNSSNDGTNCSVSGYSCS